jgi:inosine/xanthosine triphosphate pyrophosphatase family protein
MVILYATGNQDKFKRAQLQLEPYGISVEQKDLPLVELQKFDGEQIAIDKANQAFELLQAPVMVSDDA